MMMDNLIKELDGVTVLRHFSGVLKIEKCSVQTLPIGYSHVVGGDDSTREKSVGGDGRIGGEVVLDGDSVGEKHVGYDDGREMHFYDDNGRGRFLVMTMAEELLLLEKKGEERKDCVVSGTFSVHCPCICPNCVETGKKKEQMNWRTAMQDQLKEQMKVMKFMHNTMDPA